MGSGDSKPQFDTVIVRFGGEIGIKAAWTRKLYERRLASNIKAMLKREAIPYEIFNRKFGRLFIRTSHAEETSQALSHVFGVSSVSSAVETSSQLKDIIENSILLAGSTLRKNEAFAVRCRRVGSHDYTSQDVCRHVGQVILDTYANRGLYVDLQHPDVTLEVEVRENQAYIFTESFKGPGGLPLGVQPKLIGLLNGDINSVVACWMVMKRGCPVIPLYFETSSHQRAEEKRTLEAAKILFKWAPGFPRRIHVISNEISTAKIGSASSKTLNNLFVKRLMFRLAEKLVEKWQAEGIVTGDVLQKPVKENLHFLRLCDEVSQSLPIHRPLIGLEDSEIKEIAQRVGISRKVSVKTKSSEKPSALVSEFSLETVKSAETKVCMDELVELSLESLRTISV